MDEVETVPAILDHTQLCGSGADGGIKAGRFQRAHADDDRRPLGIGESGNHIGRQIAEQCRIVAKLGEAMQKATAQNPELIAKWRSYGGDLKGQTSAEFAAFLKQDDALWGPAIRKAGVKLD